MPSLLPWFSKLIEPTRRFLVDDDSRFGPLLRRVGGRLFAVVGR